VFSKTDMAKYLATWDELPHNVALGGQKNFVGYMAVMKEGKPKKWKPDAEFFRDLVSKGIINKHVAVIARQEGFPAYRANVVAYTVALLAYHYGDRFNLGYVWAMQGVSPALDRLLRAWTHLVYDQITESAKGRNVTEWCKKEECWELMTDVGLETPDDLPELSARVTADGGSDADQTPTGPTLEDLDLIMAITEVEEDAWRMIAEWGSGSKELTAAQIKLAYSMAKKAHEEWETRPTINQAKQALLVLKTAKKKTSLLDMFE